MLHRPFRPDARPLAIALLWLTSASLMLTQAPAAIEWIPGSVKPVYASKGDFYCYAPSVVKEGRLEHYWFCRNATNGVIRDHIFYLSRSGEKTTARSLALPPARPGSWDSFHVCDPTVVAGKFDLNGAGYKYALFYLGNNIDASANNQIGVAFANDLAGSWTRHEPPVIAYPQNGLWGVGQPSAINLKHKGRLLVFYTKGEGGAVACFREVTLSGTNGPLAGPELQLPLAGLLQSTGASDYLNNFDVAYDQTRDRFLAVRERHPYPRTEPRIISSALEVVSISAKDIYNPEGKWTSEGVIGPELTGHPRNHNPGIERTLQGTLPDPKHLRIVFSVSCAGTNCLGRNPLWTYSLWEIRGRITPPKK